MKTFLLLGSGELGKEFTISAKRYGHKVIAADRYANAPAMQVADHAEVTNMLDGDALQAVVEKYEIDFIIPEIEAIRTEKLIEFEKNGITVVPSAKAVNFTMDRKAIRDLAAKELGLKTAKYRYAKDETALLNAVKEVGIPCVIKPLMSSSGKGQSTVRDISKVSEAWQYAQEGSRGDKVEVIVEAFVNFNSEITLLTVTQTDGPTLFCPPIGHIQEGGDYQESWQPAHISEENIYEAQEMAKKVTHELEGAGLWGVEFFIADDGVYFSELSPRPHDTGMVTLAGTQALNEFELHLRAILGLPIPEIELIRSAANSVILATEHSSSPPSFMGLENICIDQKSDFRLFGKPDCRPNRRMGIVFTYDELNVPTIDLREKAKSLAEKIRLDFD